MSNTASVSLLFGGRKQVFRLTVAGLEELQDLTGVGPRHSVMRLQSGTWKLADIRETLRIGLGGGGMSADAAALLVDRYAGEGALMACEKLAIAVLAAALAGSADDQDDDQGGGGEDNAGEMTGSPAAAAAGSPSSA